MKAPLFFDNLTATPPLEHDEKSFWHALESPYADLADRYEKLLAPIKKLTGAETVTVVSDGAEAIAEVLFGFFHTVVRETGRNHILYAEFSEAPVIYALEKLEEYGCAITPFDPKQPLPVNPRVGLITMPYADALTGIINPIPETDIPLHVDITNILGKAYFDFSESTIDYATFDGRVLHAPHPCGCVLAKEPLPSLVPGRAHSYERTLSLSIACQHTFDVQDEALLEMARLRDHFEARLKKVADVTIHGLDRPRIPSTTAVSFAGFKNDLLLYHLTNSGLFATIGGGRLQNIAQVTGSDSAISFTFAYNTTEEMVDEAIHRIAQIIQKLRPMVIA